MGEKEKEFVSEAFASNWIAPLGPHVDGFEKQLSEILGVGAVAALNSGTAALHLALEILKVGTGDVVICQSFTFGASAFPIAYCGASPVFVDSEPESWNMDPELLEEAIEDQIKKGKKPAAIIVVHLYGMPAAMDEILSVANRFEIPVIEDAAEALGSSYKGKACGSMGTMSVLSFNGNKIITTSGGGALCSDQEELVHRARFLSTQAREPKPYYLHHEIGFNYRLSNVLAGIGRGQLEVLSQRVARRREIFETYQETLAGISGLRFLKEPAGCKTNRWLTTLLFDQHVFGVDMPERMRSALEMRNIETRPLWKPLHQQPVFEGADQYLNGISDTLFETGLCLPSGSNLTEEKQNHVIKNFKEILNEVR